MATGWFQRASAVFNRAEPLPQPFDVGCDCATRLKGERAATALKPRCPTCGTQVFILPATPYPLPSSRQQPQQEPAASAAPSLKSATSAKPRKSSRTADDSEAASTPAGPTAQERWQSLQALLRRWATPVRLVGVAIALGLVLTTVVVYRKARWDHSLLVLQSSIDRGAAAVKEGDFQTALPEYRTAAVALDVLGRQDEAARDIRRTRAAVEVAAQRAEKPLIDALQDWLRADSAQQLAVAGRGWMLFDGTLIGSGALADEAPGALLLDLPLMIEGIPVDVVLTAAPWSKFVTDHAGEQPRRVLFAAQIDRAEQPTGEQKTARVWLDGSTAVLWSDVDVYRALGNWPDDAAAQAEMTTVLEQQRQFLEQVP